MFAKDLSKHLQATSSGWDGGGVIAHLCSLCEVFKGVAANVKVKAQVTQ